MHHNAEMRLKLQKFSSSIQYLFDILNFDFFISLYIFNIEVLRDVIGC